MYISTSLMMQAIRRLWQSMAEHLYERISIIASECEISNFIAFIHEMRAYIITRQ